jgi:hypothetical protein
MNFTANLSNRLVIFEYSSCDYYVQLLQKLDVHMSSLSHVFLPTCVCHSYHDPSFITWATLYTLKVSYKTEVMLPEKKKWLCKNRAGDFHIPTRSD